MNNISKNMYADEELEKLWDEFSDVPMRYTSIEQDGAIDDDWFIFKKGTDKMDIWHWFDAHYSDGLYNLMYKRIESYTDRSHNNN